MSFVVHNMHVIHNIILKHLMLAFRQIFKIHIYLLVKVAQGGRREFCSETLYIERWGGCRAEMYFGVVILKSGPLTEIWLWISQKNVIGPFKLQPGQITVVSNGSLAEQVKASTLDPLLGIIAEPQPQPNLEQGKRKGRKGVSIMQCDMPCPITTNNITSFNLYNTCIDPSGCYHATITAQGSAQLSFRGCLNPPGNITGRQRDPGLLFFFPVLGSSFSPDHFVSGTVGRCVTWLFPCDG